MILSYLLALFILLPLLELAVLLRVHERMGTLHTLVLVIGTGFLGAFLAKAQGLLVMRDIQRDMSRGRMPGPRLMDGAMILVAAALLVTPGLLTDVAGFSLLAPPVRRILRAFARRKIEKNFRDGAIDVHADWNDVGE